MKRFLLLLCLCLSAPLTARAATARLMSEKQMVKAAVVIARGTVLSAVPRRHPSGLIVTDVTLKVDRLLKAGDQGSTVRFTELGGTLDGKTLQVPGASSFTPGEDVVVFLEQGGESLVELGVGAGKYRVFREGSRTLVERQVGQVFFAPVEDPKAVTAPRPNVTGPEPLEVFEERIAAEALE